MISLICLLVLILVTPATAQEEQGRRGATGTVTLLSTNDFHGRILPFPSGPSDATSQASDPGAEKPFRFDRTADVGGFPRLATAVNQIREQKGEERVILVHAGDTFSDDLLMNLTEGEAMIELMNDLGYDFMAFGNHDFDYGFERTRELAQKATFPMRGANVLMRESGEPALGQPWKIVEAGGVKVGLLALGYHNTEWTTSPKNIEPLNFIDGIEAARSYLPELRRRADIVVIVSHLGMNVDRVLAREVEGIDLILGGHSHDLLTPGDLENGCPITQALGDGAVLGETVIEVRDGDVVEVRGTNHVLWADDYKSDPVFAQKVERLRAPHREVLEEVIASAAGPIPRQYKSESPFDALVGDILREETGAEIALLPGVGYGISFQKGPITREKLYTLLPHPSKLVTMKLTGEQIRQILEQSATNLNPDDPRDAVGGLIQGSGLEWSLNLKAVHGDRVQDLHIGGAPLEPQRLYTVATHTGMLQGIHRYDTFKNGRNIKKSDRQINNIVENHLRQRQTIEPPQMGRITVRK